MTNEDKSVADVKAFYELADAMKLQYDEQGQPYYLEDGAKVRTYFNPLESNGCALRLQVHFCLCPEVTEYGVFVRHCDGRLLLWKEFPREFTTNQELAIIRRALFNGGVRVLALEAQQRDLLANS